MYQRYLTSVPHIAGTPADREGAEYLRDKWMEYGLDSADLKPYKILLQYPPEPNDVENANKVPLQLIRSFKLKFEIIKIDNIHYHLEIYNLFLSYS